MSFSPLLRSPALCASMSLVCHGKMGWGGKARKAVEAQGEESYLEPGLVGKDFMGEIGTFLGFECRVKQGKSREEKGIPDCAD